MPSHFIYCVTALVAAAAGVVAGRGVSTLITRLPSSNQPSPTQPRRRYPVAVLLTMAGFAAMGLRFGPSPVLPALCYLVAIAVTLGFIDARHRRLPDVLTLSSYPAAIALLGIAAPFITNGPRLLLHALLGACAAGTFYLALSVINPAGMGWGDVKLSGVLGLYLGWAGASAFIAGLLGGLVLAAAEGLALIVTGKATAKSQLPFGPCVLAAAIVAILASPVAGFLRDRQNPASPAALGAGELAEADGREERTVVLVADPAGILPLEPGAIQQPIDAGQRKPVGRPPEQP